VQRGGKKKRIKPPGTPMMTLDGKIIMNRTQYEEPDEDEDDEEDLPEQKVAEKAEPILDNKDEPSPVEQPPDEPDEGEERSAPSVFSLDKSTLLTAPLEDLFEKRATGENESSDDDTERIEPVEEEIDEEVDEISDVFGFVEDGPVDPLHPPRTFAQITKYFRVSKVLPGPIAMSYQPCFRLFLRCLPAA